MSLRLSFSQLKLFETCQKQYHFKYVLKLPGTDAETKWVDFGSAVHEYAEDLIRDTIKTRDELWAKYKLDGRMPRDEFELCCDNIQKNVPSFAVAEDKIFISVGDFYFVGYLDVVTKDDEIIDWKTGSYTSSKSAEYSKQLWCYAYLFYRKYNRLPKVCKLYFPKSNKWVEKTYTLDDVAEVEKWIISTGTAIQSMINNSNSIWKKNTKACFFCAYKNKCLFQPNPRTQYTDIIIRISGTTVFLEGDITPLLDKGLESELSYDMKDKFWIQKKTLEKYGGLRPKGFERIGRKYLYNVTHHAFRVGHLPKVLRLLQEYAEYTKTELRLTYKDERQINTTIYPMPISLLGDKELRPYQQEAVSSFLHMKSGFVEVGTGGGKTLITAEIIRRLGYKTLWICDRKELLLQTKEEFEKELGIECGIISSGKTENLDAPVILATIQSLVSQCEHLHTFMSSIRCMIVDEGHHASADSYVKISKYVTNADYRLGTTGTVKRDDGNDMILESIIGDIIFQISAKELIELGYLVRPKVVFYRIPFDDIDGSYHDAYDEYIVNNIERNKKIVELSSSGRKILILVNRVDHGEKLQKTIDNSRFIHGSVVKKVRLADLEWFKKTSGAVLIGTASIFAEGVNVPDLEVLINAAGNAGQVKTIQGLGRCLRKIEGKSDALYYDFLDETSYFKDASTKRMQTLAEQGYTIENI